MSLACLDSGTQFISWRYGKSWTEKWHVERDDNRTYCGAWIDGSVVRVPSIDMEIACSSCLLAMQRALGRAPILRIA